MNRLINLAAFFVLLLVMSARAAEPAPSARIVTSFDPDWRFFKGDAPGAQQPAFNDAAWKSVNVPHDWSLDEPFAQNAPTGRGGAYLASGVSWYRKQFTLPADASQRRLFIEFDGIMANSQVWINGFSLGQRPNGYISFGYEMTGHLNFGPGQNNVLAVRTDTTTQPDSRWGTGQGIYRHVRLVSTDPVHIERWGLFVTTPKVAADQATVHVSATVVNQSATPRAVRVDPTLFGPDGKALAWDFKAPTVTIPAGQTVPIAQDILVPNPKLWNLDQPNLYKVLAKVVSGTATLDDQVATFGIMQFEFKPATGFWLNGKNFKLQGMAVHQDGGAVGAAVPMSIWERRLTTLKQFGVNAIRTAHNPPAPEFLDMCDRVGMLVMDELFDAWTVGKPNAQRGYNLYFTDWSQADLRDTVQRDRNHPSIILYSSGNEIHDTPNAAKAIPILQGLVKTFHENDPTRPVTQALFRPNQDGNGGAYNNGLADLLDVIGTNYRDAELLAAQRAKPTTRKIVGTEQGPEPKVWQICRDNPTYSGQFVFGGIDFPGEDSWPSIFSNAGILDRTGFPKHNAYQRLSWWSDAPMVHIARLEPGLVGSDPVKRYGYDHIDNWTPMNPATYTQAGVWVYSNCEEVELFLNDKSLGSKPLTADPTARAWNVAYAPGAIKAVAKNKGQVVATHELRTSGKPVKLVVSADRAKLTNTWDDVGFVTVGFADDQGVPCAWANDTVSFKVSGPGALVAVDAGDRMSHESFKASQVRAYQGRCIAIVRSTAPAGRITVNVSVAGLPEASVTIDAVKAAPDQP